MQTRLRVTFHQISPSAALEQTIRERAAKLEKFCPDVTSCHVVIEMPHRHKSQGKLFNVRLDLHAVGQEIPINHCSDPDIHAAVTAAFDAAERRLQEHRRKQRELLRAAPEET